MIITQKFDSINEIDPEFIPSLEELLSENIPNFEFIKAKEEQAAENINYAYFLFFGEQTNAPIGYAQLEITNELKKKKLSHLFKRKNKLDSDNYNKKIKWCIPGSLNEGIVFDPKYSNYAGEKAAAIYTKYSARKDIISQEITFSGAYEEVKTFLSDKNYSNQQKVIIDTLIKNKGSYQDFLYSLTPKTQNLIKKSWLKIQKEKKYLIGEYLSFKEIFEYKTEGPGQYNELKNEKLVQQYQSSPNTTFVTFEDKNSVKAILFFIKGCSIHGFYDFIVLDQDVSAMALHQVAIMKFFDFEDCNRLHFMGKSVDNNFFLDLGYTYRKQFIISNHKDH